MSTFSRRLMPAILAGGIAVFGASVEASAASTTTSQAETLLTSSLKLTNAASSVSVNGHGSSQGKSVKIVVSAASDAAFGVLSFGGQSTTLRRVGNVIYQKSTKGFIQQQGVSSSQAAVEANKWFKILSTSTANYNSLNQYLSVSGLLTGLLPTSAKGTISKVKTSSLNGQPVEVITGTFQGPKVTLYVAKHGKPYVLRVTFTGSGGVNGITVDLSQFNKAVHATAPKGAVTQ
jgi:hypothetical protein